jgi:hypothetical protein
MIPYRALFIAKKKVVVRVALLLLAGLVFGWVLLGKTTELSINIETCQPSGIIGKIRKSVQNERFTADQLEVLNEEIGKIDYYLSPDREAKLQKIYSGVDETLADAERNLQMIYQEYPSLAPSAAEEKAKKLRTEADLIEATDVETMLKKHSLLRRSKLEKCKQLLQENKNN